MPSASDEDLRKLQSDVVNLNTTEWASKGDPIPGIGANPKFTEEVWNTPVGKVSSTPVTISRGAAFVKPSEERAEGIPPLAEIKPKLIVTLGRHSMMQFFGPDARITRVHATLRPWRDILAYACFHPAAALHQPKYREMLEQDFDGLPKALEVARKKAAERAQSNTSRGGSGDAPDLAGDEPASQLTLF